MKIFSQDFQNNEMLPARFTCDGESINPRLSFEDVPESAQSLVLIVDDPDAPAGTWTHWMVWNIEPKTREIPQASVPEGAIQGINSGGGQAYEGPCPPGGTHHYFFKLFALDSMLDLEANATIEELESEMQGHIIDKAELIGIYKRS